MGLKSQHSQSGGGKKLIIPQLECVNFNLCSRLLVSPEIFDWIDYLGTYIMGLSFATASVLYVLFFVKEPVFKMFTLIVEDRAT